MRVFVCFKALFNSSESRSQDASVYLGSLFACFNVIDPIQDLNDGSIPHKDERDFCMPYPRADWKYTKSCEERRSAETPRVIGKAFYLENEDYLCHSSCQNITVVNKLNAFRKRLATAPSWIFFKSSSSACFKTLYGKTWYFAEGCSRDNIVEHLTEFV